ncbi:MAG TPA: trigger factor, partial [Candidatus Hydrogenedentes bacterium]|nr:trigger factor [Candidatus Hydrogenedentota bacterium]
MPDKKDKIVPEPDKDVEEKEAASAEAVDREAEEEDVFVQDPVFQIDYKGDCSYEVKVEVPSANEAKQAEEMFDELAREAEVPGFRKGRAPRKLIERKFLKAVKSDVEAKLVNAAFKKLVKDSDLKPIGALDIDGLDGDEKREEGENLVFTLRFEVAPRVELGAYRDVKVERPIMVPEQEQIDAAIDEIRSRFAVFETLEGGVAAEGDQVEIDFRGTVDGEEFDGGSAVDYPYMLGTRRFFPEFEEALRGGCAGDEVACNVTFSDDYYNEKLRGKTAHFAIRIKDVKRRNLPELNDTFARQAGFDNPEDMREKVAERLTESAKAR